MKLIYKTAIIALAAVMLSSCEDYLEVRDESALNDGLFNDYTTASMYVNEIYLLSMPEFGGDAIYGSTRATASSDEEISSGDLLIGNLSLGSVGTYSAANYQPIRYINIALKKLESSTLEDDAKNLIRGQLYFFRAYQHWKMVLMHGGVPYETDVIDYVTSYAESNVPRNKTSECIAYIKADLEKAIELLPEKIGTIGKYDYAFGRITKPAAAGMLGRILLFYASPQFTPDQNSSVAAERWEAAYQANISADNICQAAGVALFDCSMSLPYKWPATTDINNIFTNEGNCEVMMARCYDGGANYSHGYENSVRPMDMTNEDAVPSNCPSLKLMQAFPNADGTVYRGEDNDVYFWKDRDPRFYSTIVYNGCYYPSNTDAQRRQWIYTKATGAPSRVSNTGFYCRKMVNSNTTDYAKTATDWVEMRYAEVLLNLAEAAAMTNREDEAYGYLGQIRKRAGIPEGSEFYGLKASVDNDYTLIEKVLNERRVEFAFEGKRFWDLRRWNMFTSDLGTSTKMLNGEKKGTWVLTCALKTSTTAGHTTFDALRDTASMETVSEYVKLTRKAAALTFKAINYVCAPDYESLAATTAGNYNFFDIQSGILTRSPAIKQTLGWTDGEFNPFE